MHSEHSREHRQHQWPHSAALYGWVGWKLANEDPAIRMKLSLPACPSANISRCMAFKILGWEGA